MNDTEELQEIIHVMRCVEFIQQEYNVSEIITLPITNYVQKRKGSIRLKQYREAHA